MRIGSMVLLSVLSSLWTSGWAAGHDQATLDIELGFMTQAGAVDKGGHVDPSKLAFWMRSAKLPIAGWIMATVHATTPDGQVSYVGSFSCNAGSRPAGDMAVVPATACDMAPTHNLTVPPNTTLTADMYVAFSGNSEVVQRIIPSTY